MQTADRDVIAQAGTASWTDSDRQDFLALLRAGYRGRAAFGLLDEFGWVAHNLPELAHTVAAPQVAPFHEHPVDTHMWRAVDEMKALIESDEG